MLLVTCNITVVQIKINNLILSEPTFNKIKLSYRKNNNAAMFWMKRAKLLCKKEKKRFKFETTRSSLQYTKKVTTDVTNNGYFFNFHFLNIALLEST